MRPAVNNPMAVPFIKSGMVETSICSLMPVKRSKANPYPTAEAKEYITVARKLKSLRTLMRATPSMAQLVVIRGRNIPRAW